MNPTIPSISELRKICQKPNYKTVGNWMVRSFLRDAAVPCTWLFLNAGISANVATGIAVLVAALAGFFLTLPSTGFFVTGVVLLQVWYYLDHVDGQIARVRGTASLTGRFFDYGMHHFVHGWSYFTGTLYLFFRFDGNVCFLFLAGLSAILIMLFNLQHDMKYKTFFEAVAVHHPTPAPGDTASASVLRPDSFAKKIYMALHKSNEIHVYMNLLTVFAVLDCWFPGEIWRTLGMLYFCFAPWPLTLVKYARLIRSGQIDAEFGAWRREKERRKPE